MCIALCQTQINGIKIDLCKLNDLDAKYSRLHDEIIKELEIMASQAMGDTPVNLNSVEQLSCLLYSRRVTNKPLWKKVFNLGAGKYPKHYSKAKFKLLVNSLSEPIYKTKARQCAICKGYGKVSKKRKDGTYGKARYRCGTCSAIGVIYHQLSERAGFGFPIENIDILAAHGFQTNTNAIDKLTEKTKNEKAKEFVKKMGINNSLSTYRKTYIDGIRRAIGENTLLHTEFMQAVTKTGRLSSRNPNFHNQPRGTRCKFCEGGCRYCLGTGYKFPIRSVVISRWEKGSITKADYSGLEFKIAIDLARCPVGLKDLNIEGFDAHSNTAKVIGVSRQDAKPHTFKPLYGGVTGTQKERAYYAWFRKRYAGIAAWHKRLIQEALTTKRIKLPSGREYSFPTVKQLYGGRVSFQTNIVNYPVQGFATADIVVAAYVDTFNEFNTLQLKSVLINEVHDEIDVDTYPGEKHIVAYTLHKCMVGVIKTIKLRYNYDIIVPIEVDVSNGPNWMDMKEVPKEWLNAPPKMNELKHTI